MRFCCIDPGLRNLAISIEEFDEKKLGKFSDKKWERDKTPTKAYSKFLYSNVYTNGKMVFYKLVDIRPDHCKYTEDMNPCRIKLTRFLDSIRHELDLCDAFFVERQLRVNPYAIEVEHHCYSYFTWMYGDNRVISDVAASEKYRYNGCVYRMKKGPRKKWASKVGLEILKKRGDEKSIIDLMKSKSKLDDICDTIIMIQGLKIKIFIEN